MTELNHPKLSIKRKPKIYVNPKHAEKPASQPPKPAKLPKTKAPKPLSREKRIARSRAKNLRRGQKAIASLIVYLPQLFSFEHPKPLKIGIAEDILADIKARGLDLTRAKVSAALMFYTQTPFYQEAVLTGGSRFDLSGQTCGEITSEQQTHASKQIEKWQADTALQDTEQHTSHEDTMTKTELIRAVSQKADISQIKARFVVDTITEAVTQTLAEGDSVSLIGFGRFEVRSRAKREGRNPRTGEAITIPASRVPVFRTGKALKDSVRE